MAVNNKQEKLTKNKEATKAVVTPLVPTITKVENYLTKYFRFRYNEVTGKIEWQYIENTKDYLPISDFQINSLTRKLIKAHILCSSTLIRSVLLSDYTPVYNPFRQYMKNLPLWDNQTDFIQQLAATVTTTNDPLWHMCFRKWIVAMVGSLLVDSVVNHTVIVFSGKQGIGKTTWILNLVPPQLKEYCFSGTINPGNKDTLLQLSECMIINMDELESLNRSELGTMKEMITKASIRMRRPYGYSTETMPRRASFAGSVNGKEFLSDTTGNRRFLCFEALEINYHHKIPLEGVFAQAMYLFQNGFQFWFNATDIDAISKNNEQYRCMAVEEELLLGYFEPCEIDEATHFFSTTELLNWFNQTVKMNVTDVAKQKMGKALRAHKFLRIKRLDRYIYALKENNLEQVFYLNDYCTKTDEIGVSG